MHHLKPMRYGMWLLAGGLILAACTPTAQSPSAAQRQQQALKDPFGYSAGNDIPDISGGGVTDYDSKAMGKDVNSALNP